MMIMTTICSILQLNCTKIYKAVLDRHYRHGVPQNPDLEAKIG
jgi:hypothetical protein